MRKRQTDGAGTRGTGDRPQVALPHLIRSSQLKIVHDLCLSPFKRSHPQTGSHTLRPVPQSYWLSEFKQQYHIFWIANVEHSCKSYNVKGTFKTCPGFWVDSSVGELSVTHAWRREVNPWQPRIKPGMVMLSFHPGVGEVERTCRISSPRVPRLQAQRKQDPRATQAVGLWPPHMLPHLHP